MSAPQQDTAEASVDDEQSSGGGHYPREPSPLAHESGHEHCCAYVPRECLTQKVPVNKEPVLEKIEKLKDIFRREGFYILSNEFDLKLATDRLEDLMIHVLLVEAACRSMGIMDQVTLY